MREPTVIAAEIAAIKRQLLPLETELLEAEKAERMAADALFPEVRVIRGRETVLARVRSTLGTIRLAARDCPYGREAIFTRDGKADLPLNGRIHPEDLARILAEELNG